MLEYEISPFYPNFHLLIPFFAKPEVSRKISIRKSSQILELYFVSFIFLLQRIVLNHNYPIESIAVEEVVF